MEHPACSQKKNKKLMELPIDVSVHLQNRSSNMSSGSRIKNNTKGMLYTCPS